LPKITRNATREERRAYWRAWYAANEDRQRSRNREYYFANRERIGMRQAEYRAQHREHDRAKSLAYAANHREEARARAKAWYAAHNDAAFRERERERARKAYATDERRREYVREWRRQNRALHNEYVRISEANRRAARNDGAGVTRAQWRELVAQHDHRCAYCQRLRPLTIDHRIPLKRGGRHEIENILPACQPCNSSKGTLTEDEFRERLKRDRELGIKEAAGSYSSHLRNAFRSWGRPRNSSTSFKAGFVPPWPRTMSR
jgi:5-methylcytosine-specific restriction endonuclease McrA